MRLSSLLICGALYVFGCRPEISEQECVPAPEAAAQPAPAVERTFLSKSGPQGGDWCQACVLSRQNFISCQKEYGSGDTKPRPDLRGVRRVRLGPTVTHHRHPTTRPRTRRQQRTQRRLAEPRQ